MQYHLSSLKELQCNVLDLGSACIESIDRMERLQSSAISVGGYVNNLSVLIRMARGQTLGVDHPSHRRAPAQDLSTILPVLHEAIAGGYPSRNECVDYDPDNLTKDVSRMREEELIGRVKSIIDGFERIIPGFSERIMIEPLSDMPKFPRQVPLSADDSEVCDLSDLHRIFRGLQDREAAAKALPVCIEAAQEFLEITQPRS
jgi:hypothetical protein